MALTTKKGVVFKGFTFPLLTILDTLAWLDSHKIPGQPEDLVITSANDSQHIAGSKHYENLAVDVRSKSFADAKSKRAFVSALYNEFGREAFTVLLENEGTANEHFHIQCKRKKGA